MQGVESEPPATHRIVPSSSSSFPFRASYFCSVFGFAPFISLVVFLLAFLFLFLDPFHFFSSFAVIFARAAADEWTGPSPDGVGATRADIVSTRLPAGRSVSGPVTVTRCRRALFGFCSAVCARSKALVSIPCCRHAALSRRLLVATGACVWALTRLRVQTRFLSMDTISRDIYAREQMLYLRVHRCSIYARADLARRLMAIRVITIIYSGGDTAAGVFIICCCGQL
jgi:hypothetical protein